MEAPVQHHVSEEEMIEIKTRRRIDSSESERPSILLFSATAEAAARCSEEGEEGKEREVSTAVVARSKYQQQIRWDSERQMMISSPARGGGDGKALEEEEQVRGECERRKSIATTETAEEEGEGEGREEQKKRKVKVYNAAALEDGMVWEGEVEEQMLVVEVAAKGAEAMMEPMRSKRVEVAVEGGAWEVVEGATTIGDVAAARGEGCIVERQRAVEMRVVEDEQVQTVGAQVQEAKLQQEARCASLDDAVARLGARLGAQVEVAKQQQEARSLALDRRVAQLGVQIQESKQQEMEYIAALERRIGAQEQESSTRTALLERRMDQLNETTKAMAAQVQQLVDLLMLQLQRQQSGEEAGSGSKGAGRTRSGSAAAGGQSGAAAKEEKGEEQVLGAVEGTQQRWKREYVALEGGVKGRGGVKGKLWEVGCKVGKPIGLTTSVTIGNDLMVASHTGKYVVRKDGSSGAEKLRYGNGSGLTPFFVALSIDGATIAVTYEQHAVVVWSVVGGHEVGRSGEKQGGNGPGQYLRPWGITGIRGGGFAVADCNNKRVVAVNAAGKWEREVVNLQSNYCYGLCRSEGEGGVETVAVGLGEGIIVIVSVVGGRILRRVNSLHVKPEVITVDGAGRLVVGGGWVRDTIRGTWESGRYGLVVVEEDGQQLVIAADAVNTMIGIAVLLDWRIAVASQNENEVWVV